ncbi:MAG: hypothetical protein NQU46_01960 [Methanolinea sp.]|nr:hypothetical protein [Methanolinea sp.]
MQSHKYFYFGVDIPVMDAAAREQFRWKFYRLALLLNGVILVFAIGFVVFFKVPAPLGPPLAGAFLVLAGVLALYFQRQYSATRRWLDDHA